MSLFNEVLFGLLMLEGVMCLILVLPFGKTVSQKIVKFLSQSLMGPTSYLPFITYEKEKMTHLFEKQLEIRTSFKCLDRNTILILIVVLFLGNCHTNYTYKNADEILSGKISFIFHSLF